MSLDSSTSPALPAIGSGTTNKTAGSQVSVKVAPEPMAFLQVDTGEVIGVPAEDTAALHSEFDKWNRLMYEQLLANKALALCDQRLEAIACAIASNPKAVSAEIQKDAREAQGWAIEWREEATSAVHEELKALDKLGGDGKKLVEMIPLVEKDGDKHYKLAAAKDSGKWALAGTDLKKPWGFKGGAGMKHEFKQEDRYKGVGKLRYASSAKLKKSWPKFKDEKKTKWDEVRVKQADGTHKIDRKKMREYLGEQVKTMKLKSSSFFKLEVESVGTLGPEELANWNERAKLKKEGEVKFHGIQIADMDLSAQAAAMRYFCGGGLSGEIAPLNGNVSIKAEGSAEVALAEAKAEAAFLLPSKEGLLLYLLDAEQIKALANGGSADSKRYDLGAVRLSIKAELKGVVGASIAGDVSIGIEMKDLETTDVDGKKKAGKVPHLKGNKKKTQRARAMSVAGEDDSWTNKAGVDAGASFFAGVKGSVGLSGAIQWRNPHNAKKEFENFASIAPELTGMLGLAGEAKVSVEYVDGLFRISAHAGLCFGAGAEGAVTLAVGAKQLATFIYWLYYNLLHAGFKSLPIIAKSGFDAFQRVAYLAICEGRAIEETFGMVGRDIGYAIGALEQKFARAEHCLELARRVLASSEKIRFSPPESKAMLIYQLTRFGATNWALDGGGLMDQYLPTQRKAVILILRQTQLKADLENVIQHIGKDGVKGDFDANMQMLNRFFAAEAPHGGNFPGTSTRYSNQFRELIGSRGMSTDKLALLDGDFGAWYDTVHASLKDDATRGYVALANNDIGYDMQRDLGTDHPLYASTDGAFYV